MIKRTLYFGNPTYLSVKNRQLVIRLKSADTDSVEDTRLIPIEDIGILMMDHVQITFTQSVITSLQDNNAVILWCGENHIPMSMTLPLVANHTYTEKLRCQIEATEPLKKQLWRQTIMAKITNQATVLESQGYEAVKLRKMVTRINSGDPENYEGQAAAIYWSLLLDTYDVNRGRYEGYPNHLFNYGYAILRAVIARNLVGSGCLPVLGIHHSNKYNAYGLADDIMEPYRPIVDQMILHYLKTHEPSNEHLSKEDKAYLLNIPVMDIVINGKTSPLMVGAQRTTASLVKCYQNTARKILYPTL